MREPGYEPAPGEFRTVFQGARARGGRGRDRRSVRLSSPGGTIRHVIEITFDNVHFTRDNPNVPSDLEQMPHLLSFLEHDGTLLANEHTPLIAHTADDILTTLTGVYGDEHGQPAANSALAPEININWAAFAGPGVAVRGVDRQTWADETDVRPTLLALTGLADDHPLNGRVLTQDLTGSAIPPALRGSEDTKLGEVYKQPNADVGSFALDTLAASTAGVRSTGPAAYARIDARLASLGAQRNALAGQIAAALNAAAFDGRPISGADAQRWIEQGQSLLDQAAQLSSQSAG